MDGAHPRVSGENGYGADLPRIIMGSSPRERGKPLTDSYESTGKRLIPA